MWLGVGASAPSDLVKALQKAAQDQPKMTVLIMDTNDYPEVKTRFDVEKHPVLISWHQGEVIARRSRPWASDVQGFIEKLTKINTNINAINPSTEKVVETVNKEKVVNNKPVKVTEENFEKEVLESDIPVVVDFWAEWCAPCRMLNPVLEKLADEFAGRVKVAKIDADAHPSLVQSFRVMAFPTMMFIKEGKIVGMHPGFVPEAPLRGVFEQLISLEIPADAEADDEVEDEMEDDVETETVAEAE
jgi:thioredoxin